MSIIYKLFKIPRTFDDFVNEAKRKDQPINISFHKSFYESCATYYNTCFEIMFGKKILR
ncbi:unnamed protein product, partial [marine sediment metagenome]